MRAAWGTMGRVLREHWFALAAWFLLGEAVHQGFLFLAAYAGATWTIGGLLVLPLAVLGRLVSYVAMFLTVRRSLPALQRVEPVPSSLRERVDEFFASLLVSVIPFLVFYTAWGSLEADRNAFIRIGSEWLVRNHGFDSDFSMDDRAGMVALSAAPVIVLALALAVRLLSVRFARHLPVWTAAVTVYAEALWAFLLITFVSQQLFAAQRWLQSRTAFAWLEDAGARFQAWWPAAAQVWESAGGLWGLLGAVVFVPIMWFTVAGLVYGELLERAVPERVVPRGRVRRVLSSVARRFDDFWDAVVFLFRAGPVLVGAYLLAFAVWALLDRLGDSALLRAVGPHDQLFWSMFLGVLLLAVATVTEPIRIALVAAAYDAALARISGLDVEPDPVHPVGGDVSDLQPERPARVVGHDEDESDDVRG